jgi:hypothetical protein
MNVRSGLRMLRIKMELVEAELQDAQDKNGIG